MLNVYSVFLRKLHGCDANEGYFPVVLFLRCIMQHSSSNSLRCVFARNFEELRRVVEINATAHALGTYVALAHMQGGTIIQTSSRAGGGPELKRRVGAASLTAKREKSIATCFAPLKRPTNTSNTPNGLRKHPT